MQPGDLFGRSLAKPLDLCLWHSCSTWLDPPARVGTPATENERGECASKLCRAALLDAELREDRCGPDAVAGFELRSREVAVTRLPPCVYAMPAAKRLMLCQEIFELLDSVRLALVAHVPRMQEVCDHDVRTRNSAACVSEPDPQIAVSEMREPLVEPTDSPNELGSGDDIRTASGDDVRDEQISMELHRVRRVAVADDHVVLVDRYRCAVHERVLLTLRGIQLPAQLARSPDVVVVEEGKPTGTSLGDPDVSCPGDALSGGE